ncbi:GNAT family N-acetyltransferase [Acidihalobacter prosperus]|uniref:L-ornithine N(alpha)-acyltransferase n=1 Tax=Acidihalobacter prosperus TaxID=160660 RepID=A0A1A6C1U5_9GAMM|nr:GNAT family N-acyltransferase [Acidihalobacter prosperus]OBS08528.1 putative hemolysin [Acidihalobacter prosperus]
MGENLARASLAQMHLVAELATTDAQVRESQRLRYRVFAEEMGAQVHSAAPGLETDGFDPYCHHLLVRDTRSGEVIGSTRILTDTQSRLSGGFYSESEFDLSPILALPGRIIEIGRTCIHPEHRNGAAIGVLWSALGRFMSIHRVDYMIGCASIGLRDGGHEAQAIMARIRKQGYLSPETLRAAPRHPLETPATHGTLSSLSIPPLLKAYLRLGAWICGEPCEDKAFNVADLLILLEVDRLNPRYGRHFLQAGSSRRLPVAYLSHPGRHVDAQPETYS